MRPVEGHLAEFMIMMIKDGNLVRLLEHLYAHIGKNVGHPLRPALIPRDRERHAG